MTTNLNLGCHCGAVAGIARDASVKTTTHLVCYCDDCQLYAKFLGHERTCDSRGGTEIVQCAMARIELTQGAEQLRAMRLSPKGMVRFYTACCRTAVGNTMSGSVPFVGLVHTFINDLDRVGRDKLLGEAVGIQAKFARPQAPPGAYQTAPVIFMGRVAVRLLRWKLCGLNQPSAFYAPKTLSPVVAVDILTKAERASLGG